MLLVLGKGSQSETVLLNIQNTCLNWSKGEFYQYFKLKRLSIGVIEGWGFIVEWKHVVGAQGNHFNERVLLSTHNRCYTWWIREFAQFELKRWKWKKNHVVGAPEGRVSVTALFGWIWEFFNITHMIWSFEVLIKWCDNQNLWTLICTSHAILNIWKYVVSCSNLALMPAMGLE